MFFDRSAMDEPVLKNSKKNNFFTCICRVPYNVHVDVIANSFHFQGMFFYFYIDHEFIEHY